ncbi:sensor histidine kinase [Aliterella atlantica]|uniref:histidine kinase n=1 Tax=Aliterella atlantica CENA595 TaxID=1618023 RepID=A0A0D8ZPQ6_9CYAN|nr:HAMP domain-containing sensor histidine kinase [Aliterella atlantica]KJH70499.1 histidine kinase [Aliterella atlantica CENA595]
MFQATRRRLAIWYTVVTAVLLLLFATGVYVYVRSTLIERIDDTLNHVIEVVERSLVIEQAVADRSKLQVNVEASFRDNTETVEDDRIDLEWFSPTGQLLWSTLSAPLDIPIHYNRTGETVQVVRSAGEQGKQGRQGKEDIRSVFSSASEPSLLLRQVTERVEVGRQVLGYLRVSHPWFEVTKPIQQLMFDLSLGTGLMVLSVGLCGWFLSGKAMEPVLLSYQRLKQFTADASHELRSPIALIQTNVQVALADPELVSSPHSLQYLQHLKVVERLTKRLGRLVDDLLFLARQDSGIVKPQFETCPLDALLMEVVEEQQLLATEKNIAIALELVDPPASTTDLQQLDSWFALQGDWNQLARLFTNLIENSLQYTPRGGKVQVKLQRTATPSDFSSRLALKAAPLNPLAAYLQIKIIDTGIGIPESALPRLFDRFYRVDPARTHTTTSSSGLGLAIAGAIVLNHYGQIHAESILHQGTTFTVTLPVNAAL